MKNHLHKWDTPVDNRGNEIGPTRCSVCNTEPVLVRCVNCGELETEYTISHGSFDVGLHSIRTKK